MTLKDIARDLGISIITVSKVMRNKDDVSDSTRNRVLDLVKELNYTPNLVALGLVTGADKVDVLPLSVIPGLSGRYSIGCF